MKTHDDIVVIAQLEVGASNTHAKQGVATKCQALLLAIEEHRARGVSGGGDDGKSVVAENTSFISMAEADTANIISNKLHIVLFIITILIHYSFRLHTLITLRRTAMTFTTDIKAKRHNPTASDGIMVPSSISGNNVSITSI